VKNLSSRISFGKVLDKIPLPNLIENQLNSFNWFKDVGAHKTISSAFPVEDHSGTYRLEFLSLKFEEPKMSVKEAKEKELTYGAPLKVVFRLHNKKLKGVFMDQEVFLGDVPFMTETGTFIYNGNERAVITQISRCPGVYFREEVNKNGALIYGADIMPSKGSWIKMETNQRGQLEVRIDKHRKLPITILLKALGVGDNDEILDIFDNNEIIRQTLEKDATTTEEEALKELYSKIRPGDPVSTERARAYVSTMFSDETKYQLAPVGRYKMNKKLDIKSRVLKKELAVDTGKYAKGTRITEEMLQELDTHDIFIKNKEGESVKVIGNEQVDINTLNVQDIIATINYLLNLQEGVGSVDIIDHLANRRLRLVGELLVKQFEKGLARMSRTIVERMTVNSINVDPKKAKLTPQFLINIKPLTAAMNEFLGGGQLSQYVDQINPLAELANKRRASALGPGGLSKERASMEARDVHHSHYGKLCPTESPEGFSVGLITVLASYCNINEYGFFETPYAKVDSKTHTLKEDAEIQYLTADLEERYYIAEAKEVDRDGNFVNDMVSVRYGEEYLLVPKEDVEYVDVSTKQIVGISASLIPFLEYDDANRAVMGANMQRQGVPLVNPQEPIVGTGVEQAVALNTKASYIAEDDGVVKAITDEHIVVDYKKLGTKKYIKNKFIRTNAETCLNHNVRVYEGQKLKKNDVIADSMSSNNGELALGRNVLIAFTPFNGYNYEDAVVLSDRLVKLDAYTTVSMKEFSIDVRATRMGKETITREIPHVQNKDLDHLDENGIVKLGTMVSTGDILVGKLTPRTQEEKTPEEKILEAIFGEKVRDAKDNSLRVPNGKSGQVTKITRLTNENGAKLGENIIETIKIQVTDIRKISEGDKIAGRHGNKGVISVILPEADMPFLPDGTPADIVLNPLGVPSRMNIGQVMETHLGMVGHLLGLKFETPVFDGATKDEIQEKMIEAGMPADGKFEMYDGRTGEKFENPVTLGVMYVLKLNHQIKDKMHARSVGPYSLITQQPLGGKANMGGQRLGEMEVWGLQGHGAAYTLREMVTYKSDDIFGRTAVYEAIAKGKPLPKPGIPEALKVLINQIRGLNMNIKLADENENDIFMKKPQKNLE